MAVSRDSAEPNHELDGIGANQLSAADTSSCGQGAPRGSFGSGGSPVNVTSSAPAQNGPAGNGKHRNGHGLFAVDAREHDTKRMAHLRLLWEHRKWLARIAVWAAIASTIGVILIPSRYKSTAQLMPPDGQQGLGMALMSALASKGGSALSGLASDLLGTKTSGELFVGVLKSR